MFHTEKAFFGQLYLLCLVVFCIGGRIQFRFGRRRNALVNFTFAAVTFGIYVFYLLDVTASK